MASSLEFSLQLSASGVHSGSGSLCETVCRPWVSPSISTSCGEVPARRCHVARSYKSFTVLARIGDDASHTPVPSLGNHNSNIIINNNNNNRHHKAGKREHALGRRMMEPELASASAESASQGAARNALGSLEMDSVTVSLEMVRVLEEEFQELSLEGNETALAHEIQSLRFPIGSGRKDRKRQETFVDAIALDAVGLKEEVVGILRIAGLTEEEITRVFMKVPSIHFSHARESISKKINLLLSCGVDEVHVLATLKHCPEFLPKSCSDLLNVFNFLEILGIRKERLGHVVSNSNCLPLHLESNLRPKLEYFQSLGIGNIRLLVERYPRLLGASLETVEKNVDALRTVVGEKNLGMVISKQPGLLVVSTQTILTGARKLREVLPEEEVMDLLLSYPHLLTLNWQRNVQRTLDYVAETCGISSADVIRSKMVHRSLDNVIRPRIEFLLSRGVGILPSPDGGRKRLKISVAEQGHVYLSTVMNYPASRFADLFPDFIAPNNPKERVTRAT